MQISLVSCITLPGVSWLSWATCLYDDELAVFRFHLPDTITDTSDLQALLLPDESSRAARYYREQDRQRFVYARSILRILAGKYLNQPPDMIRFSAGVNKKPTLGGNSDWHINISHSGRWILFVIGKASVGVDVEQVNPLFSWQELVAGSFSRQEQTQIKDSPDPHLWFYALWTRKEALIKATAKGLDDDFSRIPSLDGAHEIASTLIGETGDWLVSGFSVDRNYQAAVAYRPTLKFPKFYTLDSGLFGQNES